MSSIWTPGGEHRVPREPASPGPEEPVGAPGGGSDDENGGEPPSAMSDEERAYREELETIERELLEAPVGDVIANHCYGLFQLAALHLGQRPPHLEEARLAIDALAAISEALGDRLGDAAGSLRDGVAQIRLAYVQIAGATTASNGDAPAAESDGAETPPA